MPSEQQLHVAAAGGMKKRHFDFSQWTSASKRMCCAGLVLHAKRIHGIWKMLRAPFLYPESICLHHSWEIYDMQAAGCRLCGCMHTCVEGSLEMCPCEKNSEGHDICSITGCCIKMLNFSDREFVDTVNYAGDPCPDEGSSPPQAARIAKQASVSSRPLDPAVKYLSSGADGDAAAAAAQPEPMPMPNHDVLASSRYVQPLVL